MKSSTATTCRSFGWRRFFMVVAAMLLLQLFCIISLYIFPEEYVHTFRRIQYLGTFQLLILLGTLLIWYRCKAAFHLLPTSSGLGLKDLCSAVLALFLALVHFSWFTHQLLASEEPHYVAVLAFACTGCYVHLIIFFLLFILLEFVGRRFSIRWLTRTHLHTAIVLILSVTLTLFCFYVTTLPPFVKRESVKIRDLPSRFEGFTISLISDLHVGPTVGRSRLQTAVDVVNELKSDVVVISGDLVDGSVEYFADAVVPLKNIRSKYGVFYATGNHEYYHAVVDRWFDVFQKMNVSVLHNSNVKIADKQGFDEYICLAGVDDISSARSGQPGHGLDIHAALTSCDRKHGPIILLAHQPNAAKLILDVFNGSMRIDLILSGHTHGGQFYVVAPFAYLTNAYYWGLYRHQSGGQVYVTSGVYFWGPPMKMYRLSEIVQLTLTRET